MSGGKCVDTSLAVARPNAAQKCLWPRAPLATGKGAPDAVIVAAANGVAGETPKLQTAIRDLELLQNCMKEAGYLKGAVGKTVKKAGCAAFWYFKRDHRVGRTPNGLCNIKVQEKLLSLCPKLLTTKAAG